MGYAIADKGGNVLAIFELDSSNATLTSYTNGINCLNCGLLDSSEVNINTSTEKYKAEDGLTYGQDETYEGNTTGILMETSKTIADYLAFGVRDKIHVEYKLVGKKNGKWQECFKVVDVTPQMSLKSPGGTKSLKYDSAAIPQGTAFTISTGVLALFAAAAGITFKTTSNVVIPAKQEHVMVETSA